MNAENNSLIAVITVSIYLASFGLSFKYDYSLLLLSIAAIFLSTQKTENENIMFFWLVVGFLIAVLTATYFSFDQLKSLHFIISLLPGIMIFYLISEYVVFHHLRYIYIILIATDLILSLLLLGVSYVSDFNEPTNWINETSITFLKVPNDIIYITFSIPLLGYIFSTEKFISLIAIGIYFFIITSVIVIYRSRLSLIIIAIYMIMYLILYEKKLSVIISILLVFILFCVGVDAITGFSMLHRLLSSWGASRIPLWIAAWILFMKCPFVGHGPGIFLLKYKEILEEYHLSKLLLADPRLMPWAHNLYLESLAETGIISFIFFISLILLSYNSLIKVLRLGARGLNLQAYPLMSMLIAFNFAAFFELSFWRQWVPVVFFLIIGVISRFTSHYHREKDHV
jgi:O-antigen ligase